MAEAGVLAVALHAIGTVANGFHVLPGALNGVASGQDQDRGADGENFEKLFHFLSPATRATHPRLYFRYFDNSRSQRSFRCIGLVLAEAFEMIAGRGRNPGLDLRPAFAFKAGRLPDQVRATMDEMPT
ncbi:hypothetical protein [Sphingopyxis sp. KK2]|uniref:hypothetical protein n=1 Tax=Sphingopyxis sp. KK2 TaxID=1855727 RepID=UPI0015C311F1|nr:hypothetical protein [Sphingopyxis sp. KK2]